MIRFAIVTVFLATVGCTSRNPLFCGDGICTDPTHPFCDADGQLGGKPNTCVAVSCTPQDFVACRGGEALACDATGSNYEVTACEHGCSDAAGGCVGCVDSSQCQNPMPYCDLNQHGCRACAVDDECGSGVCDTDTGACVDAASIIYAAPAGSTALDCGAQSNPCAIDRAFGHLDALHTTVKMAAGDYSPAPFMIHATGTLHAIGATLHGTLTISSPANLRVIGLTADGGNTFGVDCSANEPVPTKLVLERSFVKTGINLFRCQMSIFQTHVLVPSGGHGVFMTNDTGSTLEIHRSLFEATGAFADAVYLDGLAIQVENSIFRGFKAAFTQGGTGHSSIQFSTFVDSPIDLSGRGQYNNNIFYTTTVGTDVFTNAAMNTNSFFNDLIQTIETVPPGAIGMIMADPAFRDVAAHDYHLTSGSGAIDAADPTSTLSEDFDGTHRPQGNKRDIGAFEFKQ